MKNNKIILYIIICVLVALSFYLFVCVSDLKDDSTNDESCNNIYASKEYKRFIDDSYVAIGVDNITLVHDKSGNLYLQTTNVSNIKNLYKEYTLEQAGYVENYDPIIVDTSVKIEAYKFDISGVKDIGMDAVKEENIFVILLNNGKMLYITASDINSGKVELSEAKNLSNIDSIYEKEQGNEILGLYAIDSNNNEYKIMDYIN